MTGSQADMIINLLWCILILLGVNTLLAAVSAGSQAARGRRR